jgi:glucose-1-phosphate thymidylyltransferase
MSEELIGLIPAAGKGVRLGLPYPKELYPVIRDNHFKPVSQFVLDCMTEAGIKHIVFVINETKHQLIGYFGNGHRFDCDISYVVQDRTRRRGESTSPGLAQALDSAYHLIKGKTVCFGMADTIMNPSNVFAQAIEAIVPTLDVILVLFPTERPEKFGMVRMDREERVVEIVDKPRVTELEDMWGCIAWQPRFTEFLHDSVRAGVGDFAIILNNAIAEGLNFGAVKPLAGSYIDLGTYDEIIEMDRILREQ